MHPILFRLGSYPIGTYGVLVVLGILAYIAMARYQALLEGVDAEAITELSVTLIWIGVIGSKLLMVLVNLAHGSTLSSQLGMNTIRSGGAVHGGIIAAAIAFFILTPKYNISLRTAGDVFGPATALGQAIGRLGCFFAGCCYGTSCEQPWAILSGGPSPHGVHPVQIYTMLVNLAVMSILLLARKHRPFKGFVFALYFMLEGLGRMVTELWRGDLGRGFWLGQSWLSTGRFTSIGLIVLGIVLCIVWRKPTQRTSLSAQ